MQKPGIRTPCNPHHLYNCRSRILVDLQRLIPEYEPPISAIPIRDRLNPLFTQGQLLTLMHWNNERRYDCHETLIYGLGILALFARLSQAPPGSCAEQNLTRALF
jgi:hypothetical protein